MKWVEKFDSYHKRELVLEGDLVAGHVFRTDDGVWHASWSTGNCTYPAHWTQEGVLGDIQVQMAQGLREALATLESTPVSVEKEPSPVELVPGSEGKLGYGYGWLRIREGRRVPWGDVALLDDGREAHIHPFIEAGEAHLEAMAELKPGNRIAGVRWFEKPKEE